MSNLGKEFWYKTAPPSGQAHASQTGWHEGLLPGGHPYRHELRDGAARWFGCVGTLVLFAAVLGLVMWLAVGHPGLVVFGDGSFGFGDFPYAVKGCIFFLACGG